MRFFKCITENKSSPLASETIWNFTLPLKTFLNVHLHVTSLCTERSTEKQDARPYVFDKKHPSFRLCLETS